MCFKIALSVVGIATRYGLDFLGIKSRWGWNFTHSSRPAVGLIQPRMQWVAGHSRGVKRPRRGFDHPPPSNADVKERVGLYLYSLSGPSWPDLGLCHLYVYPSTSGSTEWCCTFRFSNYFLYTFYLSSACFLWAIWIALLYCDGVNIPLRKENACIRASVTGANTGICN